MTIHPCKNGVAVVLLSGGLDSLTCLAIAASQYKEIHCLTFSYGQRHDQEIKQAKEICKYYGVESHKIVELDMSWIGGSALTDHSIEVPEFKESKDIPVTYVPGRNTMFISIASAYTEVIEANTIFIGANCLDYSGYPDCRPEFFVAFEKLLALSSKRGVEGNPPKLEVPLLKLSKAEIIRRGHDLGAPYELSWSCYNGDDKPCGTCDSCVLRAKGFEEAGCDDPALR